jgi:two-component system, cell cycle sensor histidine kinase and response regulator CckA
MNTNITDEKRLLSSQMYPCSEMITGNGELILVVDDEADIREITKITLEIYNYRVLTANNGVEALAVYMQYQQGISVVLMDMMMPIMDGETAIRRIKTINSAVKVIATSGVFSNNRIMEITELGVKAFLLKPCAIEELLQTISLLNKVFV